MIKTYNSFKCCTVFLITRKTINKELVITTFQHCILEKLNCDLSRNNLSFFDHVLNHGSADEKRTCVKYDLAEKGAWGKWFKCNKKEYSANKMVQKQTTGLVHKHAPTSASNSMSVRNKRRKHAVQVQEIKEACPQNLSRTEDANSLSSDAGE